MESISDAINKRRFEKNNKKRPSERGELLEYFTEKINAGRKGTKYKPLTLKYVAVRVAHISVPDLYHLKKICNSGKSFSQVFFGSIKLKYPNDF